MKIRTDLMKFIGLLGILVFLFSFGNKRNGKREVSGLNVEFSGSNSPFITYEKVNKLLIQNADSLQNINIESLDLVSMEERLNNNPMIRNAEVYITANGTLSARIEQRDPIARVRHSKGDYYIDADGKEMPLSDSYSARVPVVMNIEKEDISDLTPLLLKIRADEFMKKIVVGINKNQNNDFELVLRNMSLTTVFGKPKKIDKKIQNFKAFYMNTKKDSTLYAYNKIDLKFESQVIATKK